MIALSDISATQEGDYCSRETKQDRLTKVQFCSLEQDTLRPQLTAPDPWKCLPGEDARPSLAIPPIPWSLCTQEGIYAAGLCGQPAASLPLEKVSILLHLKLEG